MVLKYVCGNINKYLLCILEEINAGVAQSVVQLIRNQQVSGSIPLTSSTKLDLFMKP